MFVHAFGIAQEGVFVEMVENASYLRMVPCESPFSHFHRVEEVARLVAVGHVDVAEGPQCAVGKVATQSERVGNVFGIDYGFAPILRHERRLDGRCVESHGIEPGYLDAAKLVVFQPDELFPHVVGVDFRSEPPPTGVGLMAGIGLLFALMLVPATAERHDAYCRQKDDE